MVKLHLLYICDISVKAFLFWLVLITVVAGVWWKTRNKTAFLYAGLLTFVYVFSVFGYLYIQKERATRVLDRYRILLLSEESIQAHYERYDASGLHIKKEFGCSGHEINDIVTIFSRTKWQMQPNMGAPSIDEKFIVSFGKEPQYAITLYPETVVAIETRMFILDNNELWVFLKNLAFNGEVK